MSKPTREGDAAPCQECGALLDESCGIYLGGECRDPRRARPLDYGNGKTREQETQDSVQMLGLVLLLLVVAVCVAVAVVLWA